MSIFSFIKKGRQAAKEHSAKQAEKEKTEQLQQKTPYKHVPRHAASDALSGGPATWRESDRPKILEQNRRRSAMTASGLGMGGTSGMVTPVHPGMSRVNSALSHVSYPTAYASPHVHVPRAYSYSSMATPGWTHQGGEVSYAPFAPVSGKGKEVERIMVDSGRASRASSQGSARRAPAGGSQYGKDLAVSPVGSSSNSTSSQDDLEMKPTKRASMPTTVAAAPSKPAGEPDHLHHLHPSHGRRVSDLNPTRNWIPTPRYADRETKNASLVASGIPPVPTIPAMQFGTALTSSIVSSSASSTTSSITVVPTPSSASLTKAHIPQPVPVPSPLVEGRGESRESGKAPIGVATMSPPSQNTRRTSKHTRFSDLETINSEVSPDVHNIGATLGLQEKMRPVSKVTALPTTFDEASLPQHQQPELPPPRMGKLTKAPSAKLSKKNRWSLRGSKSTAVAV